MTKHDPLPAISSSPPYFYTLIISSHWITSDPPHPKNNKTSLSLVLCLFNKDGPAEESGLRAPLPPPSRGLIKAGNLLTHADTSAGLCRSPVSLFFFSVYLILTFPPLDSIAFPAPDLFYFHREHVVNFVFFAFLAPSHFICADEPFHFIFSFNLLNSFSFASLLFSFSSHPGPTQSFKL